MPNAFERAGAESPTAPDPMGSTEAHAQKLDDKLSRALHWKRLPPLLQVPAGLVLSKATMSKPDPSCPHQLDYIHEL